MENQCRGSCYIQEYHYEKVNQVNIEGYEKLPEYQCTYYKDKICSCVLQQCPCCKRNNPQWVLDCNEGKCGNCACMCTTDRPCRLLYVRKGYCAHCDGKLVPIGTFRLNGKDHLDWDARLYHKKCWKELQE
jgi:hypothetical protein